MKTLRPYPGKFEGNCSQAVAEAAYNASLDGCAETLGDVDSFGWHASRVEGKRYVFHVIEDSDGFVEVEVYAKGSREEATNWAAYERMEQGN